MAILAGGCFWGVEAVYRHVKGVKSVKSGFATGTSSDGPRMKPAPSGHVEAVRIEYDPAQVSYADLLRIFFSVAHDPTQLNRQGPDVGPEYRSAIFVADSVQLALATGFVDSLQTAGAFARPIVTEVLPLGSFREAEEYHQNYVARHPNEPYVVVNDAPKLAALRRLFPEFYRPAS